MANANDPRIERYLTSLERSLKPFPVGDRADVITEIRSHVLSALEHDPNARIDEILAALGEPETVANRYLMERGMKTAKPPISPVVKWVVMGFLGTFAMVLIFLGFVVAQFSPLLKVDDKTDSVSLLGGLIQINGEKNEIKIKGITSSSSDVVGQVTVGHGQKLEINFSNARVNLTNSDSQELTWKCQAKSGSRPSTANKNDLIKIDFSDIQGANCELGIPADSSLTLSGKNGRFEVADAKYDLNLSLDNGRVEFKPDDDTVYHYDLKVKTGRVSEPHEIKSSDQPGARQIKVLVGTGQISVLS